MANVVLSGVNTISVNQIFIVVIAIIALIAIIIIVMQWRRVRESQNNVRIMETEIELKKISMVEKDLESKRLMENPIQLPKEQQENLSTIRKSTSNIMGDVGYLHSEINERLARLEAQTEQKKLEKMLKEIEIKEKQLLKKGKL
jgi:Flp pilus assembly protein TadB